MGHCDLISEACLRELLATQNKFEKAIWHIAMLGNKIAELSDGFAPIRHIQMSDKEVAREERSQLARNVHFGKCFTDASHVGIIQEKTHLTHRYRK